MTAPNTFKEEEYATTCFQALHGADAYVRQEVLPVMKGMLKATDEENAYRGSLYRLIALVGSLIKLDGVSHFQAICAISRTIFEVRVDVAVLDSGSAADIERFHAFPSIERFRSAERLLKQIDQTGTPDGELTIPVSGARSLVTDARRNEVRALVAQHWPGRDPTKASAWPKHWSGVDSLAERCKGLGTKTQVEYAQIYSALSWQVHPGSTGYAGKQPAFFHLLCAWSYDQSRVWLAEVLRIAARRLHLTQAIEGFGRSTLTLMSLSELTGRIAAAAMRADEDDHERQSERQD